ncbi:MAG TPA: 16S rRNA (cytosine(1402)-N(4))-methyltransferase RsmH [Nevskiaceae bacterium]|nr:16S rRNA (cytosine(1402)-N(4))-methyltransferase RsmH [Nevskiaceae bacterium]
MLAHRPVMLAESLAGLQPRRGGCYIDATYGRGGHSEALLEALAGEGQLHALDQDPAAIAAGQARHGGRPGFTLHHRNFGELGALLAECGLSGAVDGILLDLGVSSPQLDQPERGFSFSQDGPLDMRMDPGRGEPVSAWLARAKEAEIADVLFHYGEERASRRIARRLVEARSQAPITRTAQLAELIQRALPGPRQKIHPATRSFQALRIFINRELEVLPQALSAAAEGLRSGGRLAVISFHSLEDRIVKRFIREAGSRLKAISREFASDAECADNPRARSAVLRVAEKQA